MAFVSVPKDLTKVKNKIIFNLTKRQLICFGIAAAVGVPFYFFTRGIIGSSNAATGMCLLMLPAFLFAMYEKDGLPLEKVLKNMITVKFIRPPVRKYQMENLYEKKFIMVRKKKGGQKSVKEKTIDSHRRDWKKNVIQMITGWMKRMVEKISRTGGQQ